ncbi:MAG TPA: hypothetical protein VGF55_22890, partial [Gemmataceae bacterium]
GRPAGRGTRRFVAVALLLAAAGAVAGALFWIRPAEPPVVLSVPVGEYRDRAWPPNPWAEQDSAAVQAAFPDLAARETAYGFQELHLLRSKLQALANVKAGQPLIVHLTALAVAHNGAVHVLPADAKPGDPATWLPLDLVLDALAACPAKQKLLLLDLSHPLAADPPGGTPGCGPLADAVADRLDEQLRARADADKLPLFVLTSCSKGELSLPLEEEHQSAFAFYVAEGLRGAADGFGPDGRADGRVRVHELADFVAARVARWARECRGLRQTPRLYGDRSDFDLTARRQPAPEPPAERAYPDWLLAGWKERDDWLAKAAYRPAPAAFNTLAAALPRAEWDWQAGGRPERVEANLKEARAAAQSARDRAKADPPVPLRSLAAWPVSPAQAADWPPLIESFLLARATAATNPKDAEKAQADRAAFLEKTKTNDDTRKAAAALVWRRLLSDNSPKPEVVADLSALLDAVQPEPTSESQAARRLASWRRPGGTLWPPAAARQLLQTEEAADRALAAGRDAFPWAKGLFDAAAKRRDDGEAMLFDVNTRRREQQAAAADLLKQAETAFAAAAGQLAAVQAARAAVEDAAVVLAATAGPAAEDGRDERAWREAAKAAAELADRLEQPPPDRDLPLGEWASATGRLTAAVRELRAAYQPAAVKKRVDDLATRRAPEYQALVALVRAPLAPAAERKRAWEAARAIGKKLHEEVRAADAAEDESHQPPAAARPAPAPLADEADRRERRAAVSVGLLRAAGLEKIDDLDATRRAALSERPASGYPGPKWDALAAALRAAWTVRLPEQAKVLADRNAWAAADRRERFLPLADRPPAALQVRAQDRAEYLTWLEAYYRGLARLRHDAPRASGFYEDAADDCRRARGD